MLLFEGVVMKIQNSQGIFLITYTIMQAFLFLFTWEMVLNKGTAVELGALSASAIAGGGTLGLLLVVVLGYLIMLCFWSGWVLATGRSSKMFAFFRALAIGAFAIAAVDLAHDALAFAFGYYDLAGMVVFNPISRFIIVGSAVILVNQKLKLAKSDGGSGLLRGSIGRLGR